MMRLLWRISSKPTDVAVTSIPQGVVHLLLSEVHRLIRHDAKVTSLHGEHGKVAGMSQTAPLGLIYPDQALVSSWQTKDVIHKGHSL